MARARSKGTTETKTIEADAELAAIEAALNGDGDMEIEIDDEAFAIDDDTVDAMTDAEAAKAAAYEDQESEIDIADDDEVVEAKAAAAEKGKAKRAGAPRAPGAKGVDTSDPKAFAEAVCAIFKEEAAVFDAEEGEMTEDQLRERMESITQKYVRAKAMNMVKFVTEGSALNVYTKIAAKLLVEAAAEGKTLSGAQIAAAYKDAGYKAGTVNAQKGQIMSLFPVMGLAKKGDARGILEPNPNSTILDALAAA